MSHPDIQISDFSECHMPRLSQSSINECHYRARPTLILVPFWPRLYFFHYFLKFGVYREIGVYRENGVEVIS